MNVDLTAVERAGLRDILIEAQREPNRAGREKRANSKLLAAIAEENRR